MSENAQASHTVSVTYDKEEILLPEILVVVFCFFHVYISLKWFKPHVWQKTHVRKENEVALQRAELRMVSIMLNHSHA